MTVTPEKPSTTLRIRTAADVVAAVPYLLGFHPGADDLVMVTQGGLRSFHARTPLPHNSAERADVARQFLAPAFAQRIALALFVIYTDDTAAAEATATTLHSTFADAGIRVPDVIQVAKGTGRSLLDPAAEPFDATAPTAAVLPAVTAGRAPLASRDDVAARVAPDAAPIPAALVEKNAEPTTPEDTATMLLMLTEQTIPAPDGFAARLLAAFADGANREAALTVGSREAGALDVLANLTRRAPGAHAAHPAAMLAMLAWQNGDGALAWCAVDRALVADPTNTLAALVAEALRRAIPPAPLH